MIYRSLEKNITSLLKAFPAVCILGPRQVGKTTLAKKIAASFKKPALYLDLENPLDVRRLSDAYTFLTDNADRCIIIDEVQVKPELFTILRSVIDADRRKQRFILLGSASPSLVKGISESLAGRIAYRELSPLGLAELPAKITQNKHWLRGGFPVALLSSTEAHAREWINSYVRSYIERDLSTLFGISFTASITSRLLSMLAHTHGSIWNAEMIAKSLGITSPTVTRYVDYLEGAYLIHKMPSFHINTRKRLVKAPKVYIRDSGLLHGISNITSLNNLKGNPIAGNSWEGYVVEQIYQAKETDIQMYYYRTQAGAECDIVLAKGVRALATIEIKLSNAPTLTKGYYQSIADLATKKNYVLVPDVEPYKSKEGTTICNLSYFLNDILTKIK